MLTVLEADVSKAMDMAVLKSYRQADINVEMKVKNTGSADINLMRISDDVPGLFTSPDLESVRLDIDGDELLSDMYKVCLLYTSPSPRDLSTSRMPSSA